MQGNKENNPNTWKEKLDELEIIPGESIDSNNALWTKLQDRITQKKSPGNKLIWYAVAASIAFSFGLLFFSELSKKPASATTSISPNKTLFKKSILQPNIPTIAGYATHNQQQLKPIRLNANKSEAPILATETEIAVTNITQPALNIQSPDLATKKVSDSINTTLATINSKPKLRVVHINELDENPRLINYYTQQQEINRSAIGYNNGNNSKIFKENNSHFILSIPLKN